MARIYLLLISLFFIPVSSFAQVNAEQVLNIGRNVLGMEDYMLAIQYFNQAIKAKPYLSDPYFFRAIAKLSLEDYAGAERDCSLAIERNKFKSEAYKVRGFARQHLGLDSLAIQDYDRGLEYNPYDKYFLFYKSVAQTEVEDYAGADSTFNILLRQFPKFEDGFTARGRLKLLMGDTVSALEDIDRTLKLSKAQANPYLMRADIKVKRKQWKDALIDLDEAIRLLPDEADLYLNRAYLRYNVNDLYGTMEDYNHVLELDPGNLAAVYNRALLSTEVRDFNRAVADFSTVLRLEPSNFHALYNRALIFLERQEWAKAQADLLAIAKRYPKFYPVYYALSQCRQGLGDMRGALAYMTKADDLVRSYVDNPVRNPLDRPTIDNSTSNVTSKKNVVRKKENSEEDDMEVMEKFNQLITSSDVGETRIAYNERIKGKVQDRNLQVEPEPPYALSLFAPPVTLRSLSNYFRELDNLNRPHYISYTVHLVSGSPSPVDEYLIKEAFDIESLLSEQIDKGKNRPVDFLARGIIRTMLKNFTDAISDFDKALENNNDFTVALMGRGYARWMKYLLAKEDPAISIKDAALAIDDYDAALRLNPQLVYAWFNKGVIYYTEGDFQAAIDCFSKAIAIDPDFGQAFFNRGLCYLKSGGSRNAFSDLSKAGELGIIPSYNLLKRLK